MAPLDFFCSHSRFFFAKKKRGKTSGGTVSMEKGKKERRRATKGARHLDVAAAQTRDGATQSDVDGATRAAGHAGARALQKQQRRIDVEIGGDGARGPRQQRVGTHRAAAFRPRSTRTATRRRSRARAVDALVVDDPAACRAHDVPRDGVVHNLCRAAPIAPRHDSNSTAPSLPCLCIWYVVAQIPRRSRRREGFFFFSDPDKRRRGGAGCPLTL